MWLLRDITILLFYHYYLATTAYLPSELSWAEWYWTSPEFSTIIQCREGLLTLVITCRSPNETLRDPRARPAVCLVNTVWAYVHVQLMQIYFSIASLEHLWFAIVFIQGVVARRDSNLTTIVTILQHCDYPATLPWRSFSQMHVFQMSSCRWVSGCIYQ